MPTTLARNTFGLLALGFLIFPAYSTVKKIAKTPQKTLKKKIYYLNKKYGDRIVNSISTISELSFTNERVISIKTFEELVNVADELGKPIIYQPPLQSDMPHSYYVIDADTRYQFRLL